MVGEGAKITMKISLLIKLALVLILVFSLAGCGSGGSTSTSGGTGSIIAKLQWSEGKSASILEMLGLSSSSVPSNVVTVRIIVTGSGMANIQKDFPVSDGKGLIDGVPVGSDRTVTAQGLDSGGNVAYQGSKANVTVAGGQTTDIGTITMLPVGTACLDLINQGKIIDARDVCVGAADAYGDIASNDADTARFFAAFSRVASLWYNMSSDGNPNNGLNIFGDVLDAFGCSNSGRDPLHPKNIVCPKILPTGAPTGAQLQTFIAKVVRPELEGAMGNLSKISSSFKVVWTEPFGGKQVTSDFGDALTLRAASGYLLGTVITENSYNLDANIAQQVNQKPKIQGFLANNPNFLKLANSSELSAAQDLLGKASDDAVSAINFIQSRTGNQTNYLIHFGTNTTATEINNAKSHINEFKGSLAGPVNVHDDKSGNVVATLNLTKFFAGLDVRSLLPQYTGDMPGLFPDPHFGGIWTNYVLGSKYDPNHDFNKDGAPDIIKKVGSASLKRQGAGQKHKARVERIL
jgi:hypothetical protein